MSRRLPRVWLLAGLVAGTALGALAVLVYAAGEPGAVPRVASALDPRSEPGSGDPAGALTGPSDAAVLVQWLGDDTGTVEVRDQHNGDVLAEVETEYAADAVLRPGHAELVVLDTVPGAGTNRLTVYDIDGVAPTPLWEIELPVMRMRATQYASTATVSADGQWLYINAGRVKREAPECSADQETTFGMLCDVGMVLPVDLERRSIAPSIEFPQLGCAFPTLQRGEASDVIAACGVEPAVYRFDGGELAGEYALGIGESIDGMSWDEVVTEHDVTVPEHVFAIDGDAVALDRDGRGFRVDLDSGAIAQFDIGLEPGERLHGESHLVDDRTLVSRVRDLEAEPGAGSTIARIDLEAEAVIDRTTLEAGVIISLLPVDRTGEVLALRLNPETREVWLERLDLDGTTVQQLISREIVGAWNSLGLSRW